MIMHVGVMHILFNMWCVWDLGAMCELLYGQLTFAAIYLIFGLVVALIASYYLGEFSLPRFAVTASLRSLVLFVGYNFVYGAIFGRTDNAAHIGGLITGLIFGALIARAAPDRDPFRRVVALLAVLLIVLACGAWLYRSRSYLIHSARGGHLLDGNKTAQAIQELQTAIRQRPDYVPARFALGVAYVRRRELAAAEAELKRVIELQPWHQPARYALGVLYVNQGRTQ